MYQANGTYYTEEHSISFGRRVRQTRDGLPFYVFIPDANTWEDWHLIPSSRPSIAHPEVITRYVEIPGANGAIDMTNYLTGNPQYKMRTGSLSFFIDNGHQHHETIRERIVNTLHGKTKEMVLDDDPSYVYEGRFSVGALEPGESYSKITISYQLNPYKMKMNFEGYLPVIWDTFNFETDYDYSFLSAITVSNDTKTFQIYANSYMFNPIAEYISGGNVNVSFGGVTATVNYSSPTKTLGVSKEGSNDLVVSGTGTVRVRFRGGSL